MKLGLYMYDEPIQLDEDSTKRFLRQYDAARETITGLLDLYSDGDVGTRDAIFYMLGLRTLIDDFLEFCTTDVSQELIERLLNGDPFVEEEIFDRIESNYEEDDEGEILVEFDDEEE